MNTTSLSSSLDALKSDLRALDASTLSTKDRLDLANELTLTRRRLQTPFEVVLDHLWAELIEVASIKTLIDAGVFRAWETSGQVRQSSEELARLCKMDPNLTYRLVNFLSTRGHFFKQGNDSFERSPFSQRLSQEDFAHQYEAYYETQLPSFTSFPKHAKDVLKYHDHVDPKKNLFVSLVGKENTNIFDFITSSPQRNYSFGVLMKQYVAYQSPWTKLYPVENLMQNYTGQTPLMVDIGANHGDDLRHLCNMHPDLPKNSLVLQDLEAVIDQARQTNLPEAIQTQAIDFFVSQPIRNARVYFLHAVLHDWPDSKALEILAHTREAMLEAGKVTDFIPKLLIMEIILQDPPLPITLVADMTMMMCAAAAERTEIQWRTMLKEAGFEVINIYFSPDCVSSVMECQVLQKD